MAVLQISAFGVLYDKLFVALYYGFFGLLVSRHCIPAGSYWKTGVTVSPGP